MGTPSTTSVATMRAEADEPPAAPGTDGGEPRREQARGRGELAVGVVADAVQAGVAGGRVAEGGAEAEVRAGDHVATSTSAISAEHDHERAARAVPARRATTAATVGSDRPTPMRNVQ